MWRGHKTNMYSYIKVYQKYLVTSIKEGCATCSLYVSSGPKAEGVPTNNQRGRGSGPCRLWRGLDKARHIVPTALLVRVQRFRNDLYKAVKGPNIRHIVLSMIAGSYWRRRRRFTIFEPDEMKFASPLTFRSRKQDQGRRQAEWFLVKHNPETIFHQICTEVQSMT